MTAMKSSGNKRRSRGAALGFMNSRLAPGTLCYLIRVGNFPDVIGRVVEVVAGPHHEFDDARPGPYYDIRADWLAQRFPERDLICQREKLVPLNFGDGMGRRKRERQSTPAEVL